MALFAILDGGVQFSSPKAFLDSPLLRSAWIGFKMKIFSFFFTLGPSSTLTNDLSFTNFKKKYILFSHLRPIQTLRFHYQLKCQFSPSLSFFLFSSIDT